VAVANILYARRSAAMLSRYNGGTPLECTYLTGSITARTAALEMHAHWCDLERLIKLCRPTARRCICWTSITSRVRPARHRRGVPDSSRTAAQDVTWSGWYLLREENENTRKLRSAFMATPTLSSETLICGLFRDELSRLSLSLSPPAGPA
jgi:hypothetical protein